LKRLFFSFWSFTLRRNRKGKGKGKGKGYGKGKGNEKGPERATNMKRKGKGTVEEAKRGRERGKNMHDSREKKKWGRKGKEGEGERKGKGKGSKGKERKGKKKKRKEKERKKKKEKKKTKKPVATLMPSNLSHLALYTKGNHPKPQKVAASLTGLTSGVVGMEETSNHLVLGFSKLKERNALLAKGKVEIDGRAIEIREWPLPQTVKVRLRKVGLDVTEEDISKALPTKVRKGVKVILETFREVPLWKNGHAHFFLREDLLPLLPSSIQLGSRVVKVEAGKSSKQPPTPQPKTGALGENEKPVKDPKGNSKHPLSSSAKPLNPKADSFQPAPKPTPLQRSNRPLPTASWRINRGDLEPEVREILLDEISGRDGEILDSVLMEFGLPKDLAGPSSSPAPRARAKRKDVSPKENSTVGQR